MKNTCPSLTEEGRKAELRKEAERRIARAGGNQQGRSFQISAEEARGSTNVVSGTYIVNSLPAKVLFDSSANRSFIAIRFAQYISNPISKSNSSLEVEIADSKVVFVNDVYRGCEININFEIFKADLIPMIMGEFDIILGMDWLSHYKATIFCNDKTVHLKTPSGEDMIVFGERKNFSLPICSYARARRHIYRDPNSVYPVK